MTWPVNPWWKYFSRKNGGGNSDGNLFNAVNGMGGQEGEGRNEKDAWFWHDKVKPGRILWNRHFNHLATCFNGVNNEELAEGNLENFFEILRAVVLKKLNIWRDVIAFLEFDFIPVCLLKISKEICTLLVDFLLTLAHDLETLDAEDFPLNALHATSTFERFLLKQDEEIITGTRQAELAYIGCQLVLMLGITFLD
ncbi:unnamed protein product [Cylicocyclus nassatus]|uniref:KNTC1 first ARM-repeats domain-containing protein n=1 Tax=Cylicocyclus nassatus TaxID=53992 RepID=A0AA36GXC9_CYLNA|nr:unnamed protein product [Cylicocyclus nassatus]